MAKRTSLSQRRASDARGVDVLFGSPVPSPTERAPSPTEPSAAAASAPKSPPKRETPIAPVAPASDVEPEPQPEPKPPLAKVTLYIRPDQVVAIEAIQLRQRQQTGKKPDKSDLVQEALDLLAQKYGEA